MVTSMKKKFDFIANWKMQFNFDEEMQFAASHYDNLIKLKQTTESKIILCPSFLSIYPLSKIFDKTNIEVGAQDCSKHNRGSFTGQVSAKSLSFAGANYCIIGHSETRKEYNESDSDIAQKFAQLISYRISPILCIGENEEEFKENKVIGRLTQQLEKIFNQINSTLKVSSYLDVYIAYEPTWSIGTGNVSSVDHLDTIFSWLYKQTQKIQDHINWKLLYGGSVDSKNIGDFKKIEHLNGFLLGKSSLNFDEFKKIIE